MEFLLLFAVVTALVLASEAVSPGTRLPEPEPAEIPAARITRSSDRAS